MAPPIKTTAQDIEVLFGYLKAQVGWVPLEKVRKTIESKHADNRKIEAGRYLGLLERDGANIRLSETGRAYANGDEAEKVRVMREALRSVPLYFQTFEWIHHTKKTEPTRADVGNYWHDRQADQLDGAQGAALTDAVIFFFRMADAAGLGKFISPGNRRPVALLRCDLEAIASLVSGTAPAAQSEAGGGSSNGDDGAGPIQEPSTSPALPQAPPPPPPAPTVNASPAVHVNIEIHIAADATPATVEEIFRNMRKYVLSDGT